MFHTKQHILRIGCFQTFVVFLKKMLSQMKNILNLLKNPFNGMFSTSGIV